MNPRENDPPAAPPIEPVGERPRATNPAEPPVRLDRPVEEVEMGGEPPCQLPRFWDAEE